jgi:hypothetical protein
MNKSIISSRLEEDVYNTMNVSDPSNEFVADLRKQLHKTINEGSKPSLQKRTWWWQAMIGVATAILITVVAVGPQNVWAMMQNILGYIPGIGFVDDESTQLMIEEPIVVVQDGITITVTESYANSEKTLVTYQLKGFELGESEAIWDYVNYGFVRMQLANGEELELLDSSGKNLEDGFEFRSIFSGIPVGIKDATFVLPFNSHASEDSTMQSVEFQMEFVEVPSGMIFPAMDVIFVDSENVADDTTTQSSAMDESNNAATSESAVSTIEAANDFDFMISHIASTENGYIIDGFIQANNPDVFSLMTQEVYFEDANGKLIPATLVDNEAIDQEGVYFWRYEILTKDFTGPLTIFTRSIRADINVDIPLNLDLKEALREGDTIKLNQEVMVENEAMLLKSVSLIQEEDEYALTFEFDTTPMINFMLMSDQQADAVLMGSGGSGSDDSFSSSIHYSTYPSEEFEIVIRMVNLTFEGYWAQTVDLGSIPE